MKADDLENAGKKISEQVDKKLEYNNVYGEKVSWEVKRIVPLLEASSVLFGDGEEAFSFLSRSDVVWCEESSQLSFLDQKLL